MAAQDPEIRYSLGSVLNHVLLHQTIIGEEALLQLAKAGESAPDVIVGCTGGGSNFARTVLPVPAREAGREDVADDPGGRAGLVPVAHPGCLRLRLR